MIEPKQRPKAQGHIQTIAIGYRLVSAIEAGGGGLTLKTVASAAGMASWKAYPYLVSLLRMGIVVQNKVSLRYSLGPSAAMLGLSAIRQSDIVKIAPDHLREFQDTIQLPVYLSVMGNYGPTIVQRFDWNSALLTTIKLGQTLPLMSSTTGALFLSYFPLRELEAMIKTEIGRKPDAKLIKQIVTPVRETGLATSEGHSGTVFSAVSAGIFDHEDRLAASVTVMGMNGMVDLSRTSPTADRLRAVTKELSLTLGHSTGLGQQPTATEVLQ